MDDSIKQKLNGLLELLKNPDIKSKQAAFNACYSDLTQVKEIVSWETIVAVIKQETGVSFDARTASNMYGRSRRKMEPSATNSALKKSVTSIEQNQKTGNEDVPDNGAQKRVSNPGQLKELRNRHFDLDELKNENGD